MALFASLVRGYRRVAAQLLAPQTCVICLDVLPTFALGEAKYGSRASSQSEEPTFVKLACKHKFCTVCIKQYVDMKIQAKEVDNDQLVCPELQCKRSVVECDIRLISGDAALQQVETTRQRKRDERNPNARWCPRTGCDELIVCSAAAITTFTCPACQTVGCFRCRGFAHRFAWFCTAQLSADDASYVAWEKSVGGSGGRRAVRPCPQCRLRIWKTDGCNHMTCTGCRFEFCWVCAAVWDPSHYTCYELPQLLFDGPLTMQQQVLRAVVYAAMLLVAALIAVCGVNTFITLYLLVWGTVTLVHRIQERHAAAVAAAEAAAAAAAAAAEAEAARRRNRSWTFWRWQT